MNTYEKPRGDGYYGYLNIQQGIISATPYRSPIVLTLRAAHYFHTTTGTVREPPARTFERTWRIMPGLNRKELETLERRELQLTILAAVFFLVLAGGLAVFMYPLVFLHPEGNVWTMRVAFFGFIALTILFMIHLFNRHRMMGRLKRQLLNELERNLELRLQASTDLLHSMPDVNHFWDRLTMEYRRAMTMQKTLSLLLVKAKPAPGSDAASANSPAWGDAAKAMTRKLRPTDSIYHLSGDVFGLVLPETDVTNARLISLRLQTELEGVCAKHRCSFTITVHNYPEHVKSSHELEDIVKSILPENGEWTMPAHALTPVPAK
jgi:hypothetical protein